MLLHVVLAGTVQGVGFRNFTKKVADELGIKGWVKNNPDGTVEIMAEGDEKTLRKFLDIVEQGPPLAEVRGLRFEFLDEEGGFKDFEIIY